MLRALLVLSLLVFVPAHCYGASPEPALYAEAEAGDADAQYSLGFDYTTSRFGSPDGVEALKWLTKAAEQGHARAQLYLSAVYVNGDTPGVPQSWESAYYWLRLGEKTHALYPNLAGFLHSDMIPDDFGIPEHLADIEKHLTSEGIASIKQRVAEWEPGRSPVAVQHLADLQSKAEKGDVAAQVQLGGLYAEGADNWSVKKDRAESMKWYRRAADQGNMKALADLVWCGDTKALAELRSRAENGSAEAQEQLAVVYVMGWGVNRDYGEAAQWRRKAAEQGNAEAQYHLAEMYERGDVTLDYAEALKWYRKAAEAGYEGAENELAGIYQYGRGVPKDYAEAYFWYSVSGGDVFKLADQITPEQKAGVDKRVTDWRATHPIPTTPPKTQGVPASNQ